MSEEILATVHASAARRFIGVGTMAGLGGLVLYLALATAPALHWRLFLLVMGGGALFVAQFMWQTTGLRLELTQTELRDSNGRQLVALDDVEAVNRGAFAFKPSNGFMIKTKSRQSKVWRPGMWWRMGRMVAVGGVTPGSQTKPMADIMAAIVSGQEPFSLS
ncbi:hypothetical protein [Pseudoprimorskyibacter insulae]|uniref:PH domain-containing protein n=1 Tax=Pseudoprimorskyibacter insulae TaxID=1695997 RepID=A0A2R8AQW8_9RHOB|nr:hypothetical protein [Pseudoprimorskyibacter insulae]SPF78267.1 hypothetical protein PRI8871_00862 [Pseudoprimorskyibacter insulae]